MKTQDKTRKWNIGLMEPSSILSSHHSITPAVFPAPSFSWMMLTVYFFQSRGVHMGINLCGRDIRMTEHRLDGSQVRAALE
jgi:hypothetical protein